MAQQQIEPFANAPIGSAPQAYPYDEYSDDENVGAFFNAYNQLAAGYLQWYQQTQMAIYTQSTVTGKLLDWVGNNLYGVTRPIIPNQLSLVGPVNTTAVNAQAVNAAYVQQGLASYVSDDIYKRMLTWVLYKGDGQQMSLIWIRRRIARFLYGANGGDITVDKIANVGLALSSDEWTGAWDTAIFNTLQFNEMRTLPPRVVTATIPSGTGASSTFQQLVQAGMVPFPFQLSLEVAIA